MAPAKKLSLAARKRHVALCHLDHRESPFKLQLVAWMKHSGIRDTLPSSLPDSAMLHPGYPEALQRTATTDKYCQPRTIIVNVTKRCRACIV